MQQGFYNCSQCCCCGMFHKLIAENLMVRVGDINVRQVFNLKSSGCTITHVCTQDNLYKVFCGTITFSWLISDTKIFVQNALGFTTNHFAALPQKMSLKIFYIYNAPKTAQLCDTELRLVTWVSRILLHHTITGLGYFLFQCIEDVRHKEK